MDRFMLKDVLDYPSPAEEAEVLRRIDSGIFAHRLRAGRVASPTSSGCRRSWAGSTSTPRSSTTSSASATSRGTRATTSSRAWPRYVDFGASPRASIAFTSAARARALIDGRNHVVPDDVKALTHRVLRHRVTLGFEAAADEVAVESIIDAMVNGIRTP